MIVKGLRAFELLPCGAMWQSRDEAANVLRVEPAHSFCHITNHGAVAKLEFIQNWGRHMKSPTLRWRDGQCNCKRESTPHDGLCDCARDEVCCNKGGRMAEAVEKINLLWHGWKLRRIGLLRNLRFMTERASAGLVPVELPLPSSQGPVFPSTSQSRHLSPRTTTMPSSGVETKPSKRSSSAEAGCRKPKKVKPASNTKAVTSSSNIEDRVGRSMPSPLCACPQNCSR